MADTGRPPISEDQFKSWLDALEPFIRNGHTLYYAMDKAMLITHKTAIYEKYALNDWFAEKINVLQGIAAEAANETFYILVEQINAKVKTGLSITREEIDILKHFTDKHRTAQKFFVTRTETAATDDSKIGKILDSLEKTDFNDVAREAEKQMVADYPSLQN